MMMLYPFKVSGMLIAWFLLRVLALALRSVKWPFRWVEIGMAYAELQIRILADRVRPW